MKKYVSVALATAMIASMGVTAFAKNDQYKYDVKDVTFINKTDNGDDEIYFQLKVKKGNTEAFIVDDATTAQGDVAGKVEALEGKIAAYTAAKTPLSAITADKIEVAGAPTAESVKLAAEAAVDALKLDATYAGKVKTGITGLDENSDAAAVVNAIKAASTKVKGEADTAKNEATTAHTAADALDKDYDKAVAISNFANVTGTHTAGTDKGKSDLITKVKKDLNAAGITDAARQTTIATAIVDAVTVTGGDYQNVDAAAVKTAAGEVKKGAAKAAKDDAAKKKEALDAATNAATLAGTEDAKVQALTEDGVAMPEKGKVTPESLTKSLQTVVAEGKYQADVIKTVVSNVDFTKANTPDAVAEAIKAMVATKTTVFDDVIAGLDKELDALGKVNYVAYDEIEDIDDLKVSLKLTAGEDYVADYYIDEIDDAGRAHDGNYGIIIELNDNYTTSKQKIKGTLTLKNKTKKLEEMDFSYNLDIHKVDVEGDGVDGDYAGIKEMTFDGEDVYINLVEFNEDYNVAKFTKDVENIELEDNNGFYFDVKASDQGKLNLAYDNVAIKSVTRVAPVDADLTFFNFYGYPTFDFTGTVTLTPEEDDVEYFVYKVDKDGKISKVNAKLNDDGDAYEFKTRTLGCYVLSDMELNVDDINAGETTPEDKPADGEGTTAPDTTVKPNPGTGL